MTAIRNGRGVGATPLATPQSKPTVVDGKMPPAQSGLPPARAPSVPQSPQAATRPRAAAPTTPGAGAEPTAQAQEMKEMMTQFMNSWWQERLSEQETNMKELYEKKEDDDDDTDE